MAERKRASKRKPQTGQGLLSDQQMKVVLSGTQAMMDAMVEATPAINRAMQKLAVSIVADTKPFLSQLAKVAGELDLLVHEEYLAAGAIYGDTHEGQMRWVREKFEIAGLRQQADDLEARHADLKSFRDRVQGKGPRQGG